MNRKLIVALVVVALVTLGWLVYRRTSAPATEAAAEVTMARRGALEQSVSATGSLAPAQEHVLAYPAAGTVVEALVAVGDEVGAGTPLVRLDGGVAEREVGAAQTALEAARTGVTSGQASLAELEAGPKADELEVARIGVEQAKDRLWGAQAQRDATCGNVKGSADQSACDSANASVLQAEDGVRLAQIDVATAASGPTATELAAARDKVAQARSALSTAEGRLEDARAALADATVTAPITGTVTALDATPGARVTAGQQAATVSDLSAFEVEIKLDETDVSKVTPGLAATVVADAFPDETMTGTVTAVAPVAQVESGVVLYPVTVRVAPGAAPVRAGMTVDVGVVTAAEEAALVVPLRAVTTEGEASYVTVLLQPPSAVASLQADAPSGGSGGVFTGTLQEGSGGPGTFSRRAGARGTFTRTLGSGEGGFTRTGSVGGFRRSGTSGGFPASGGFGRNGAAAALQIPAAELEGNTERRVVTVGLTTDNQVQIVSGLEPGTWVVVSTGAEQPTFSSQNRGFFFGGPAGPPPGVGGR